MSREGSRGQVPVDSRNEIEALAAAFTAAAREARPLLVEARLPPAVRPGLAYLFANRRT
jgi:hypothetical protein